MHAVHPNLKIVGGKEAEPNSWPSIVWIKFKYRFSVDYENKSVIYNDEKSCGGTLLNSDTILTAAHCIISHVSYSIHEKKIIYKVKPNEYYKTYESMYNVYLGMHSKSNISNSSVIVSNISKIIPVSQKNKKIVYIQVKSLFLI